MSEDLCHLCVTRLMENAHARYITRVLMSFLCTLIDLSKKNKNSRVFLVQDLEIKIRIVSSNS